MSAMNEQSTIEEAGTFETETGSPEPGLSMDDIFHVLQNERRRRVLQYLEGKNGPVDMRDIAEQVAAWEHDTSLKALTSNQRQRVYIALYQSHLPKLDNLGLIDYNQSRGIVERNPTADRVSPYLADGVEGSQRPSIVDGDDRLVNHYVFATAISIGIIGAAWVGIQPVADVSGLILATIVVAIYAVVTGEYLKFHRTGSTSTPDT